MVPQLSVFSESFIDIGESIFLSLDLQSILRARRVCVGWYKFIKSSPRIWEKVLFKLRRKFFLIDPIWMSLQREYSKEDYHELAQMFLDYLACDHGLPCYTITSYTRLLDFHIVTFIYCEPSRLIHLWEKIRGYQHPSYIMHVLIDARLHPSLAFLVQNMPSSQLQWHLDGHWDYNPGFTPLHQAAEDGNVDVVTYLTSFLKDKNPSDIKDTLLYIQQR